MRQDRNPGARTATALVLSAILVSCSGGGGGGTTEPPQVAEIAVTPTSLDLGIDETRQLTALAYDGGGAQVTGVAVTFSSQSPAIVETTAGGLVTALAEGEGVIRASVGSVHTDVPVVVALPPTTASQVGIPSRPFGVSVSSDGVVLVTQQDANSLTRVNLPELAATGTIDVGVDPGDVTFSADGERAYATNYIGGTISVIDVATSEVIGTYPANGGSPTHAVLSQDESLLYVSTIAGWLNVYSTTSGALVTSKLLGSDLNGLARFADRLYVSSTAGYLYELTLPTLTVSRTAALGGRPQDVAVTSDGGEIFVADEMGSVRVINRSSGAAASIPIGAGGFGLAIDLANRFVFVSQPASGTVTILRRSSRQAVADVNVGGMPRRIAVDGSTGTVVVANEGGWADFIR